MTERGEREGGLPEEPPVPAEPFDPSTRDFPAVDPGDAHEGVEELEAEQIERRHEAVTMDTSTFMAIPAPTPTTPFVPPEFDERQGRLGRSTAFFSIATAFSRVAGLVRVTIGAGYLGLVGRESELLCDVLGRQYL